MEYVDVVNENDEVVGTVSKQEAHEKGLLHRTVIAEIIDSENRWTLVEQSGDRQDPGQFVSPVGGHVTAGESEDTALKREALEEFGLTHDFEFKLVGKKIYNREVKGRKENHLFIVYEIRTDAMPVLNEESVGFEKFSKQELDLALKNTPEKFGSPFRFIFETFSDTLGLT